MEDLSTSSATQSKTIITAIITTLILYTSYITLNPSPTTITNSTNSVTRSLQSRRHAILHVGPPKTASTSIQTAMTRDTHVFKEDGYYVKGPFEELVNCMKTDERSIGKCPPDMREAVMSDMRDAQLNYANLFISSEGFGDEGSDLNELEKLLQPWDDVTIVMGYRRVFDWLPSKYHQYHRKYIHYHKWLGRDLFPSLKEFLTKEKIKYYVNVRFVPRLLEFYGEKFSNIKVFNLHDVDDVVSDFYCNVIPEAPRACDVVRRRTTKREKMGIKVQWNPSLEEIHYIRLARAAVQMGLLEDHVDLKEAVEAARFRQERNLNLKLSDFPQECLSMDVQTFLLELSIEIENRLFPEWYARPGGEQDIKKQFHEAAITKLCNPNVQAILMDEKWQRFFISLNGKESAR
mmetsp:Transcript_17870/g.22219  ORF Transcript_17870/g.22219 Transcript_17870/m.22219 type:complete len:404 (-) Transcript_17870:91-1302(-)